MKKFAKMSLVAAVAVAGMTTANAKDLTEAIKGVDVSGTVVYRYNDYSTSTSGATSTASATNYYKVGVSVKAPVNDDVNFNSRFIMGSAANGLQGLNTATTADTNLDVELSTANFSYSGIANTTIIAGKQGIATPWTNAIDSDGNETTGTGIVALSTFGPVTGAVGYINQHNITDAMAGSAFNGGTATGYGDAFIGTQGLTVAALMGSFGPVKAEAWYLDHSGVFDSYFLKASGSFDIDAVKVSLYAQMTEAELEQKHATALSSGNDYGLTKAGIKAKVGIFGAAYDYGKTEKDGSGVLNSVAKNGMIAWSNSLANKQDADMHMFTVDAQVLPELNVMLRTSMLEKDSAASTADEIDETYVQLTYKMSKNLSAYLRLGEYDEEGTTKQSSDRGRLQVQYSF